MFNINTDAISSTGLPVVLPTSEAAPALNRAPQTLRKWACLECGPIRPIRINGRLAWRVSDIKALLGEGSPAVVTEGTIDAREEV